MDLPSSLTKNKKTKHVDKLQTITARMKHIAFYFLKIAGFGIDL